MAAPIIDIFDLAIQNDDEELFNLLMIQELFNEGETKATFDPHLPPFNFASYTDSQCIDQFRFRKADIPVLAQALGIPEEFTTSNGCKISQIDILCMLLRRLAYPNRLTDLERIFVRPKSTLSHALNELLNALYERHHQRLDTFEHPWMSPDQLQIYAHSIHAKGAPLRNCVGFIDGTVRAICRPSVNQRLCYNGHKRVHAIKFQSVVAPNGLVIHLYGPLEGRRHDCALLRMSGLQQMAEQMGNDRDGLGFCFYGDPAYPVRPYLLSPFRGANISREQQMFNAAMSSVRESVEWEFGKIINNFAFLDFKKNLKILLQPVAKYYIIGALLSNCHTCLYGSQTSSYFNLDPPSLQEYLN